MHTIREIIILLFTTTVVKGMAHLITHSKCMNVVIEPLMSYSDNIATVRYYGLLNKEEAKLIFASEIIAQSKSVSASGLLWERS